MRLKLTLSSNEAILDLNYNYHLASAIFHKLKKVDKSLSLELHKPFGPKFFTFSKIFTDCYEIEGEKIFIKGPAYFFISSPKNEIIAKLAEGFLINPEVKINGSEFFVSEIQVVKEQEIGSKERFVTMSPIYASTVEVSGAVSRCVDLYPSDERFYEVIRKNLVKKYRILYGKDPESDELEIEPLNVKPKRIRIKNTWHKCVEMVFIAKGSRDLLEVGYKAGFGSKNSMGFGMVKVDGRKKI
ncbi:MAG: CRISPR-associated endoribonuclease Cas6 [Archaeoglobaceae archaeon]|nr:CRISPR-associated endoribonuclease Cas6 [Archaeoglobaceae archaeon]